MPKTKLIQQARDAAIDVLLHNLHGPFRGLPRTAGWAYPEPYTRDLMIAALGTLVSGSDKLMVSLRRVLQTLAENQSQRGHIPSLVHDPEDRGASDTTPLFLLTLAMYRRAVNEPDFLSAAAEKALTWMSYQNPSDRVLIAQMPTTDWRDEQWVIGFGLFVNVTYYAALRLHGRHQRADALLEQMGHFTITGQPHHRHVHEGLVVRHTPYYALYSYKLFSSERFDLLGNSLAILTGTASATRARNIVNWVERECRALRASGDLAVDLPPNFFPYVHPSDPDWYPRYAIYNRPGEYHNGGIWPFICGFYVAALVAAGRHRMARRRLAALARAVQPAREHTEVSFGFNEYLKAQDGTPCGQDWQTWSAAMFLYAAHCVETGTTPFFDAARAAGPGRNPSES